jgi:hypothetical protein
MAAIINTIIPPQSFEIVRDRIGRILADELLNQLVITGDTDLNVGNYIERTLQFDKVKLPAVNVMLAEGTYGGQTVIQSDGTYRYYIDVYVKSKSSDTDPGDQHAMRKLHRLLGVCRAILEDARYKTLAFTTPPGFIMNRHIESLQIQNPNQKEHDATNSVMGRLIMSVKVPEVTSYIIPKTILEYVTNVRLDSTDEGYTWVRLNGSVYDTYDFSFDNTFHIV